MYWHCVSPVNTQRQILRPQQSCAGMFSSHVTGTPHVTRSTVNLYPVNMYPENFAKSVVKLKYGHSEELLLPPPSLNRPLMG